MTRFRQEEKKPFLLLPMCAAPSNLRLFLSHLDSFQIVFMMKSTLFSCLAKKISAQWKRNRILNGLLKKKYKDTYLKKHISE